MEAAGATPAADATFNSTVPNQVVLTFDNVSLKIGLLVDYQVVDPELVYHKTQNWRADLHTTTKLALRSVIGDLTAEEVLLHRSRLGVQLLARAQPAATKIGIQVLLIEPAELLISKHLQPA